MILNEWTMISSTQVVGVVCMCTPISFIGQPGLSGSMDELGAKLRELHIDELSIATVLQLTLDFNKALDYLDRDKEGNLSMGHKDWKELFCEKNQRLYYVNDVTGYNSWDAPSCFKFQEWLLDCQLYGISILQAKEAYEALDSFLTAQPADQTFKSLAVLSKLVGNVAACNNSQAKFRMLKTSNPKLKEAIWDLPGAQDIILLLGWRPQLVGALRQQLELQQQQQQWPPQLPPPSQQQQQQQQEPTAGLPPHNQHQAQLQQPVQQELQLINGVADDEVLMVLPAAAPLSLIKAIAARLQRLASKKGHTGQATAVAPDGVGEGRSGRPPSSYYGQPGFRYQEQIWHCSLCDKPINDGSERLWTGKAEAPRGEYRFHCTTCSDPYNLCEVCWDLMTVEGQPLHPTDHAFEHIGPRMTRHNDYYSSGGDGGWSRRQGGPIPARAMARLRDRTGITNWG